MILTATLPEAAEIAPLVREALARPLSPFHEPPSRWALVDVARQRLLLMRGAFPIAAYPVSSAANGIGGLSGSQRTPPGWHRVHARIGDGAPFGAVFESRIATGAVWDGEPGGGDLILTRVLTLDGLEDGVNRGGDRDSLERYIYLHGTPHEGELGAPRSHGCVRLANADVLRVFEWLAEGDPVAIVGEAAAGRGEEATEPGPAAAVAAPMPDPFGTGRFHYAGIGGSGMSALAQFQAMSGGRASGSDRAFDNDERADQRAQLESLGIAIAPQDGSGAGGDCTAVVASTAVEAQVPDVAMARRRGLPVVHRSALLAHFVASRRTIAVSGTSGKSSVVAMIFEILRGAGLDPSVITGGELVALQGAGLAGNAWAGRSEWLVVEADESDGSLVRYRPAIGVVLNLQKDHKPMAEVYGMFRTFERRTREAFVCGDDPALAPLAAEAAARGLEAATFGADASATWRADAVEAGAEGSGFEVDGVRFSLPAPGLHNVENAIAAIAACAAAGVPLASMVAPLAAFAGVARRFQVVGNARGVQVVDDFAHNPAKLRAAIATARRRAGRVLAVYQAHGYGPTRFLRAELVEAFAESLGPGDRLWLLEIFYAGGTAVRDFSAADLVAEIAARDRAPRAAFAADRAALVEAIAAEAREGDLVLVMGARDPSLTGLARRIVERLGQAPVPGAAG